MVRYPLDYSQILNRSKSNTFGWVRKNKKDPTIPRLHQGWDLVAPIGTPVYPVAEGEIVYTKMVDDTHRGYGVSLCLKFDHEGKTYYAFYAHLLNSYVVRGDMIIDTTCAIGSVGDSGNAFGIAKNSTHLHFEIRNKEQCGDGEHGRIDPVVLFGDPPYDGVFYIDG